MAFHQTSSSQRTKELLLMFTQRKLTLVLIRNSSAQKSFREAVGVDTLTFRLHSTLLKLTTQFDCEVVFTKANLSEFKVPSITPIALKFDNTAAIYLAPNPVYHERTKHVDIDCHFVREKLLDGLPDIPTKSLTGLKHHDVLPKLGVVPTTRQFEGDDRV
ncbi:hypothetical protein V2J09_017660 [Rumex salicifolius]